MSVKVSLLKKSKVLVDNWLDVNYNGDYNLFYSLGTDKKGFKDQFLKIELDCQEKMFGFYASRLREALLNEDIEYENLSMKIFNLN